MSMVERRNLAADPAGSLEAILKAAKAQSDRGPPPVHLWNPAHCGDIGLEIRSDGSWWYAGGRIGREPLVRLFSGILRKDEDGRHYLVTPVEKVIVHVADAPFLAVRVDEDRAHGAARLVFTTNVGDVVVADAERRIRVETDPATLEPRPYVLVRGRLEARLTRPVFYELVSAAEEVQTDEGPQLVVRSGGATFALGPAGAHLS